MDRLAPRLPPETLARAGDRRPEGVERLLGFLPAFMDALESGLRIGRRIRRFHTPVADFTGNDCALGLGFFGGCQLVDSVILRFGCVGVGYAVRLDTVVLHWIAMARRRPVGSVRAHVLIYCLFDAHSISPT